MARFALAAVLVALAGCGGKDTPVVETTSAYSIQGDALTCSEAAVQFDFVTGGVAYHGCEWTCAAYQGTEAQQVTITFRQTATGWVVEEASLNPLDPKTGAPIGC